ncbi:MAG: 4Fe-4S binding protein [Gammaproteobacteria bacterium]|nr:4Fe-4S binding protein [Gammaproteobacteria bacterium]
MSANDALSKIPVITQGSAPTDNLRWKRKAFQTGFILALILIPTLGIFRIDVSAGFVVLDRQIWFSDFAIVFGFWLSIACSFILLYSFVGTAFCGWACPQNSFSTVADALTSKMLGKRAVIDWEKAKTVKIAAHKNNLINWIVLGLLILLVSMVISIIPLLYFVPPKQVFGFFTFQDSSEAAYSIRWIYMVFVFIAFVNYSVVRQYVCRYMCIYRMWQYLFKTKETLHIDYDASRKKDCEKCSYCQTQCMVGIDPKNTNMFDSCTNCGACISACNAMHAKKNEPGLLSFRFGERRNKIHSNAMHRLAHFRIRFLWVLPPMLIGITMFSWGLFSYQPYHMALYKSENHQGSQVKEYRINFASKLFRPAALTLEVEGLEQDQYSISSQSLNFSSVGRQDVFLRLNDSLPPGMYNFIVRAKSDSGWEGFSRMNHFVMREK